MKKEIYRIETFAETIANAVTHGVGALLSVAALVILIFCSALQPDNKYKLISSIIYGSALVITYVSSTLYHSFPQTKKIKYYFRVMDHSSIFLLIAGTYTPFALVVLKGDWGWTLFTIIWALAIFGITFKLIFGHRHEIVSIILYLLMGWLGVIAIKPLYDTLSAPALTWLVLGGLLYTVGVIFYVAKRPFSHTIWHLFCLGGSICHFFGVLFYIILGYNHTL